MSVSADVTLYLVAWFLLLLLLLAAYRVSMSMSANKAANSFSPSGSDLPPLGQRLTRAHANCYEFLPFALAVLIYAQATGQAALTDGLAMVFLAARVAQSIVHIASTSVPAVLIRFLFFIIQFAILAYWVIGLLG